jgi:hypothetical protein
MLRLVTGRTNLARVVSPTVTGAASGVEAMTIMVDLPEPSSRRPGRTYGLSPLGFGRHSTLRP